MKKERGKVRMSNGNTPTPQHPLTHTLYNSTRLHAHPPTNAPTHTTTHMHTHKSCNTITSPCWSTSCQIYSINALYHSTMTGAGVSQEQGEEGRGWVDEKRGRGGRDEQWGGMGRQKGGHTVMELV